MAVDKILGVDKDIMVGYIAVFGVLAVGVSLLAYNLISSNKENLKQKED